MIELTGNTLRFSFPEIHPDAVCEIEFQRTLRIPDDGKDYPLPAGLGEFPLFDVNTFPVSEDWKRHGGAFLPMHPSEAMWMRFWSPSCYPFAMKVATGKITAITGDTWSMPLSTAQDYLAIPEQPWLDGFCVEKGVVRQFVATALGEGHTAEEQLTGRAEWGGLQLVVYPMRADEYRLRIELPRQLEHELDGMLDELNEAVRHLDKPFRKIEHLLDKQDGRLSDIHALLEQYKSLPGWDALGNDLARLEQSRKDAIKLRDKWEKAFYPWRRYRGDGLDLASGIRYSLRSASADMGMAAGGRIKQEIAKDPYGLEVWDQDHPSRCFVHLVGADAFTSITGKQPPTEPVTPAQYAAARIPWFDYYLDGPGLEGSEKLAKLNSLATSMQLQGKYLQHNEPTVVTGTIDLSSKQPKPLHEGVF